MKKNQHGFTIVELIVVIAIIAILATLGTFFYITSQSDARDTARKTNLQQIAEATLLYDAKYPTKTQVRCGGQTTVQGGDEGIGMGWFFVKNVQAGLAWYGTKSIYDCYKEAGVLGEGFKEPKGCETASPSPGAQCASTYMKYTCRIGSFDWRQSESGVPPPAGTKYYTTLYTHLETIPAGQKDFPKEGLCMEPDPARSFHLMYNMNYAINTNDPNPAADGSSSTLPKN